MALLAALRPRLGGLLSSSQSAAASWRAAAAKQGAKLGPQGTTLSTAAVAEATAAPETYTASAAWLHWLSAAGFVTCIVTVQASMNSKDNAFKGQMMTIHKSTGLLLAALAVPRLLVRLTSKLPGHVPGSPKWEQIAATLSHYALYIPVVVLPGTGIAMGYFGGKGLPFFSFGTIPGAAQPNGAVAKTAFGVHKQAGKILEYGLLPAHVGGAGLHLLRGSNIFKRINPFA